MSKDIQTKREWPEDDMIDCTNEMPTTNEKAISVSVEMYSSKVINSENAIRGGTQNPVDDVKELQRSLYPGNFKTDPVDASANRGMNFGKIINSEEVIRCGSQNPVFLGTEHQSCSRYTLSSLHPGNSERDPLETSGHSDCEVEFKKIINSEDYLRRGTQNDPVDDVTELRSSSRHTPSLHPGNENYERDPLEHSPNRDSEHRYDHEKVSLYGSLHSGVEEDSDDDTMMVIDSQTNEEYDRLYNSAAGNYKIHCEGGEDQSNPSTVATKTNSQLNDNRDYGSSQASLEPREVFDFTSAETPDEKVFLKTCTGYRPFIYKTHEHISSHASPTMSPGRTNTREVRHPCMVCTDCDHNYSFSADKIIQTGMDAGTQLEGDGAVPVRWSCVVCNLKSTDKWSLQNHVETHTEKTPFCCKACNYYFVGASALESHLTGNHCDGKEWKSITSNQPVEGKSSTGDYRDCTSSNFHHQQEHPGKGREAPSAKRRRTDAKTKRYPCEVCSFTSPTRGQLKRHLMIHTGERPFSCALCDWRSRSRWNLKVHENSHFKISPYTCRFCTYYFTNAAAVDRHVRKHHFSGDDDQNSVLPNLLIREKSNPSDECDYTFNDSDHLQMQPKEENIWSIESILMIPERNQTGENMYACNVCDYTTAYSKDLKVHMRTHSGDKPFACEVCDYTTAVSASLTAHMRTHTGEKPYSCKDCNFNTAHSSSLKNHIKTHKSRSWSHTDNEANSGPGQDVRDFFPASASDLVSFSESKSGPGQDGFDSTTHNSTLKRFKGGQTVHKKYACEACDYTTAYAKDLKVHMRTHSGEKPYSCKDCNFSTAHSSSLKNHVKIHLSNSWSYIDNEANSGPGQDGLDNTTHNSSLKTFEGGQTAKKKYACEACGHTTAYSRDLKAHMRVHSGDKPFACEYCNFKTAHSSYLKSHERAHTGVKPFSCLVCDYKCTIKNGLIAHLKTHIETKPIVCEACDFVSTHPSDMKSHMKTHAEETLVKCKICDYKNAKLRNLKVHMKARHTGEKPFACKICDHTSNTASQLEKHQIRARHNIINMDDKFVEKRRQMYSGTRKF